MTSVALRPAGPGDSEFCLPAAQGRHGHGDGNIKITMRLYGQRQ
jgi:hypothetical protein